MIADHRKVRRVLVAALASIFLGALDQTIVATALPSIGQELKDPELLGWVIPAYLLAMTAAMPIVGKLSDLRGRRQVIRSCIVLFVAASAACAVARTMPQLVVGRLVQGVGGGGITVIAQITIADVIAPRERGRYSGQIAAAWATAGLLGPLLGGALTQYLNWRWVFLINLPLGAGVFYLVQTRIPATVHKDRMRSIGYVDAIVFASATGVLLVAVTLGGVVFPWGSRQVIGCIGAGVILGLWFAIRQNHAPEPIIPPRYVIDPVTAPLFGAAFIVYGVNFSIGALVPLLFQLGLGQAPTLSGAYLVPILILNSALAFLSGRYIARTGRYRIPWVIGLPIAIAAFFLLGLLCSQLTTPESIALLVLAGSGIGPLLPLFNILAQNAALPEDLGAVTGALAFFRMSGSTILTACGTTVIMERVNWVLPRLHSIDLNASGMSIASRAAVRSAFGEIFFGGAAGMIIAFVLFLVVEHRPLRGA